QGVDLVYRTNPATHQLEYDFNVAAGTDAGRIVLGFDGVQGVSLDAQGELVLHAAGGDIVQQAPVAYQDINGVRQYVASRFTLDAAGNVRFALGDYDHGHALTIDPSWVYISYLGGGKDAAPRTGIVDVSAFSDIANAVAFSPLKDASKGG